MTDKERIDSFWFAVQNSWDIEPREYFEREAPKTGNWSPEAMAVHHMWKRDRKPAPDLREDKFAEKAKANIAKWGVQNFETLVVAMAEELGEIAQAVLQHEHEGGSRERIYAEAIDLGALCVQILNQKEIAKTTPAQPEKQ